MAQFSPYIKHLFLILIGIIVLLIAFFVVDQTSHFCDVLINIGSDLIGVTVVFLVFQLFEPKQGGDALHKDLLGTLSNYSASVDIGGVTRNYDEDGDMYEQ
jgi:hypothetical protein